MVYLKRKIADRDHDDLDLDNNSPTYQKDFILSTPFTAFSYLSAQWKSDVRNTSFYIARLPARPPSTLSNSQLYQRHRQQKHIVDVLINIRRAFFRHIATAESLFVDESIYSLDFASDIEEIAKGLRYVVVRWESFLKRNTPDNLQNGRWVSEVGLLANQMWARLTGIGNMLGEIEEVIEDRGYEWRRFDEVEDIWREDYEKLLEQERRIGTTEMWMDWNKYFDRRLKYLNNKREVVQQHEGNRYREHKDWLMMTEKIDAAYDEWIKWRDERGPEEVELSDGRLVAIF